MPQSSSIPPVSERDARVSILTTVLGNYIVRQVALTALLTCRGWSQKPAWFWRPFTAGTLLMAAIASLFWPWLGGDPLYKAVFGVSFFQPSPPNIEGSGTLFVYPTLCYIIWSIVLLPHTLVRIGVLICTRFVARRHEVRPTHP